MRRCLFVSICLIGCGCKLNSDDRHVGTTYEHRLASIAKINQKCALPPSLLQLQGADVVLIQPTPNVKFENVHCAVNELWKMHPQLKLGFIANEYIPEMDKKH